ncbi:hypothetical protein HPB50_006757 [Hyalomma asiaticum]|uniref:Uncharacterized protein n=1 Tax=Hyalomma asiaticum TaxID=266040 RepID=A0ACB7SLT1_HYAAI|nr:hypothetical protein HPB50_006757 [Hyalomma asiaticum]
MEKRFLPSMWKAESIQKLESSGAALTQSVELILDVQERFATVPNGPVADRVTSKLKAVLDKNPGFYVLKQVSNVLSGADSKIPEALHMFDLTSLSDVEFLRNRIAVLGEGKLQCLGSLSHLKEKFAKAMPSC